MNESGSFELALRTAAVMPAMHVSRERFMERVLGELCPPEVVAEAIRTSPMEAGVARRTVEKAAKMSVAYESSRVSTVTFSAGLPAGLSMLGMVPADVTRYMAHALRVTQKLAFLYGWPELLPREGELDEGTAALLTLFFGVMMDVDGAADALRALCAGERTVGARVTEAVKFHGLQFTVRHTAQTLGVRMPKEVYGRRVSRLIPIVGGVDAGALTYVTYKPMADKLRRFMASLEWDPKETV